MFISIITVVIHFSPNKSRRDRVGRKMKNVEFIEQKDVF